MLADRLGSLEAGQFDLVLADVPCSNTGVLARRAEVRQVLSDGVNAPDGWHPLATEGETAGEGAAGVGVSGGHVKVHGGQPSARLHCSVPTQQLASPARQTTE